MRLGLRQALKLIFSGRAVVLVLRAAVYHWMLPKPEVFYGYLQQAGYPTDAGSPSLTVMLASDRDRARFHQAICYAIDNALREVSAAPTRD